MIHPRIGPHTYDELLAWTRCLRYFRYFPPQGGHANDGDLVELAIMVKEGDQREPLIRAVEALGPAYPSLRVLADVSHQDARVVRVYCAGDSGYDLEARHFDELRRLEPEISKVAEALGAKLEVPAAAAAFAFERLPERC